ncbi:MAG: hypothetical protein K5869_05130 [Saccharofermentans sp.]|nr:hypothetical protein [Saccharofermentans sp.]
MVSVYSFDNTPDSVLPLCGGKGASLIRMTRMGLPVPEGMVIPAGSLSGAEENDIRDALASLSDKYTYAVRSSALNEDGSDNSFAGQYETVTDVARSDLPGAVRTVAGSASNSRVKEYLSNTNTAASDIAVVIQRFVKPEYAGVLFTADAITGSSREMVGNFVEGEGEALVSGQKNASEFRINTIRYSYSGSDAMKKHARSLYKYACRIRSEYGCETDIEWAVSGGRLYILQARPVTTLKRFDPAGYLINGSRSGDFLLTKTNVGEIFMKPLTPVTFSVLEEINTVLYLPCWLDAVDGQAYMNVSVLCSMLIAMGMKEAKAYDAVKDLVGNLPSGKTVPIFPFDRKKFKKNLWKLLTGGHAKGIKSKMSKAQKLEMVRTLPEISRGLISEIRSLDTNEKLYRYGGSVLIPKLVDGLSAIMASSGMKMVPLFNTRGKLEKLTGEETAKALLGGCLGIIESMKPLLFLEDVIDGKITEEEFMNTCGQRSVNEMELSEKHPFEDPDYLAKAIEDYKTQGISAHNLKAKSEREFGKTLEAYCRENPGKAKRVRKMIEDFREANAFREEIRAKGVWCMCVLREWLLALGRVNNLGDDVFMLYIREAVALAGGDTSVTAVIPARKANYERYLSRPAYPNIIIGRFDPDEWISDPARRNDFYCSGSGVTVSSDVKGFPGAAGKVTGKVRVIESIDLIDTIETGEILVTSATNIGWTRVFPKVSAIITDIGAPLSHAAIVAREFGIPAVVGCGNATTVLKTGDTVEVDGLNGTVVIK